MDSGAGNVSISDLRLNNGGASGSTFPDNCGGAIYNAAFLTLQRCELDFTHASLFGGAIHNDGQNGNATLTAIDCTFYDNGASASGGAIFNAGYTGHATANLTNCTLAYGLASQYDGAIYNDGTLSGNAALTLINCTFFANAAGSGIASGVNNDGVNSDSSGIATLVLRNTIFKVNNPVSDGANLVNDGGTVTSQGHNLSNDPAGGDGGTGPGGLLNATGDKRNTDPMLGTVGNNGGPTPTIPLLAGSPAINTGDDAFALSHDQRYFLRNGVSDIGAFEFNGTLGPLSAVSRKVHGSAGTFDIPLPLSGAIGVECRNDTGTDSAGSPNFGRDHEVVLAFSTPVTVGGISVATGIGGDASTATSSVVGNNLVVDLHNVPNLPRQLTINLTNVNDGTHSGNITVPMGVLLGDTVANRAVNSTDVSQVKLKSGQAADATNFRNDITVNGTINATDVSSVKLKTGTGS